MAQYIFNKLVKEAGVSATKAESAGIYAKDGSKMSDNAKLALKELGITTRFKSQAITNEIVRNADLIVAMTARHKVSTVTDYNCLDKTITFAEIGAEDVSDPYGGNIDDYRKCASVIFANCVKLIRMLLKEKRICLKK